MAPVLGVNFPQLDRRAPVLSSRNDAPTRASLTVEGGFVEAWAQGYNVGSLIILILIVFCNYRSGILLHKLILLELVLALWHGTFIFWEDPIYGWYLSSTATLLFISYQIHNVVSWLKIRPFLPRWGSRLFIFSLLAVQPWWVAEAWSNFEYFNNLGSDVNVHMRPFEALVRDPWWIFTTWKLINAIKKTYGFNIWALVKINTRFGVMLACMFLSIIFLLTDVVINARQLTLASGVDPYWRFALVFKCASDTIFLDDFKSVLDDIIARKFSSPGGGTAHTGTHLRHGSHSHTRSYSTMRGDPALINWEPTLATVSGPEEKPQTKRERSISLSFNPFKSHDRRESIPKIQVQKETTLTVTSEPRNPSHNSWTSEEALLKTPEAAHKLDAPATAYEARSPGPRSIEKKD